MNSFKSFVFLVAISAFIFLPSCSEKNNKKDPQLLTFSASMGEKEISGDTEYFTVRAILSNNSPDTIGFVSMYCSWQDPYTLDTKKLIISVNLCDKNFPRLIKIPPHGKDVRVLLLTPVDTSGLSHLKFRVGFNLVTAKDDKEAFANGVEIKKMSNVIWSDTLQLK